MSRIRYKPIRKKRKSRVKKLDGEQLIKRAQNRLNSLHNLLKGKQFLSKLRLGNKIGRSTALSNETEKILVGILIKISDVGLGLTKYEIFRVVE
jgi:hypothetical protein